MKTIQYQIHFIYELINMISNKINPDRNDHVNNLLTY